MQGKIGQTMLAVATVGLMAVALGACAKSSVSGSGGSGTGAGQTAGGSDMTGGSAGSGSGAAGAGTGAGAGAGRVGAGGPGATMFPTLPSPTEFSESTVLGDVHFDFDRYVLRAEAARVIDANAKWLVKNPGVLVLIEGHADERGTNEYNLGLGDQRAKVTREQLVARGVAPSRITLITYGEERPLCGERQEACWAKNRRAHFLVKTQ